jgi:hypothetical protein
MPILLAKYFSFDVIWKYLKHHNPNMTKYRLIIAASFAFGRPFGFMNNGKDITNLIALLDRGGEAMNAFGSVPNWARPLMKYLIFDSFW